MFGKLLAVASIPAISASWAQAGTGHPRKGDEIFDHFSASADDVSLEECQAACAGLNECIGINYNDRYCWVFSEGCAPPTWADALSNFQAAAYEECPSGKPDNFLLAEDNTLQWYANPAYHACESFGTEDECAAEVRCAWTDAGCTVTKIEAVEGEPEHTPSAKVTKTLHSQMRQFKAAPERRMGGSSPTVGSDPITYFGGKAIQFWLPMDTYVSLISMDGFEMLGMASQLTSLRSMQWFSDLTLKYNNRDILHIGTQFVLKKGLKYLEAIAPATKLGAGMPLRFLDVTTVDGEEKTKATVTGSYFLSHGSVIMDAAHGQGYLIYKLNTEVVTIKEAANPENTAFTIHAAKANKFSDATKQLEHLHLDCLIGDIATRTINGGILPQIWGLQAKTPEVEKMLERPY